jgi:hypothetical protein
VVVIEVKRGTVEYGDDYGTYFLSSSCICLSHFQTGIHFRKMNFYSVVHLQGLSARIVSCWRAQSQHVFSFRSRWDLVRYRTFCSVPFLSNWFCSFWFVFFRSVPFCFFPFLSVSFCSLPFLLVRFVPSLICDVLFRSGMCLFFLLF